MKIIYTEKDMTAPVRSAVERISRVARSAKASTAQFQILSGSPEDFCNQILEAEKFEKQK